MIVRDRKYSEPSRANVNDMVAPSFHMRANGSIEKEPKFTRWTSLLNPEHGIVFHFAPMMTLPGRDYKECDLLSTFSGSMFELYAIRDYFCSDKIVPFGNFCSDKNEPVVNLFIVLKELMGDLKFNDERDDLLYGKKSAKKTKTADSDEVSLEDEESSNNDHMQE